MATPVLASAGSIAAASGTTITTNAASGVTNGDLLVMYTVAYAASFSNPFVTPSGWTYDRIQNNSFSGNYTINQYSKIANGSGDAPTVSLIETITAYAGILRITGQKASGYLGPYAGAATNSSSHTVPSLTTLQASVLMTLCIYSNDDFVSVPSGWTQVAQFGFSSVKSIQLFWKNAPTTGSYGGESFTSTSSPVGKMINAWNGDPPVLSGGALLAFI